MLKKITVEQLRMGMHVHEFCSSWMDHPFWRTKFVLDDPEDLRQIQTCGIKELWIDVQKGLDVDVVGVTKQETEAQIDAALVQIASPKEPPPRVSMAEEVARATRICANSKQAMVSMFHEARMGKAVDHEAAGALVEEITDSVQRNPGALISLARLKTADDYTYMHSVAVCALMVALSRQLSLDEKATREAGMAGLLHDLGKLRIPDEILDKPGKLDAHERLIMNTHSFETYQILHSIAGFEEIALWAAYHHEEPGGKGYPFHVHEKELSIEARILRVADIFQAMAQDRPYRAGWPAHEVLGLLKELAIDERLDASLVALVEKYLDQAIKIALPGPDEMPFRLV